MSESSFQFAGLNALVTGGTRNIGRGVAEGLADGGANVAVLGGSDLAALDATLASLSERPVSSAGLIQPMEDADGVRKAVADLSEQVGPFDILVSIAAVRPSTPSSDISLDEWDYVYNVNVRAPFILAQEIMPGMKERRFGRIVLFSGINFYIGRETRTHVVSSKGAVVGLTRALASEGAKFGITVNTVVPGSIDTERSHPEWFPNPEKNRARQLERIPMGRRGTIAEAVAPALFFASPACSYITGQDLLVTGGLHPLVQD